MSINFQRVIGLIIALPACSSGADRANILAHHQTGQSAVYLIGISIGDIWKDF